MGSCRVERRPSSRRRRLFFKRSVLPERDCTILCLGSIGRLSPVGELAGHLHNLETNYLLLDLSQCGRLPGKTIISMLRTALSDNRTSVLVAGGKELKPFITDVGGGSMLYPTARHALRALPVLSSTTGLRRKSELAPLKIDRTAVFAGGVLMLCIIWMLSGLLQPDTDKQRRLSLKKIPHAYMSSHSTEPVIIGGVRHVPWESDDGEILWDAYVCGKRRCGRLFPAVLPERNEYYDDTAQIRCPHCQSTDVKRYYPEDSEEALKNLLHP